MNLKILILAGTGIWFAIQNEKVTQPEISIESKKEERSEITLISVYDNYQVDPELKTT